MLSLPSASTVLARLQSWYAAQANGVWEHSHGVEISTLDNPGWSVRIDLNGTPREHALFTEVRGSYDDAANWWACRKVGSTLEGHCGPSQLETVLSCLLDWLEAPDA